MGNTASTCLKGSNDSPPPSWPVVSQPTLVSSTCNELKFSSSLPDLVPQQKTAPSRSLGRRPCKPTYSPPCPPGRASSPSPVRIAVPKRAAPLPPAPILVVKKFPSLSPAPPRATNPAGSHPSPPAAVRLPKPSRSPPPPPVEEVTTTVTNYDHTGASTCFAVASESK